MPFFSFLGYKQTDKQSIYRCVVYSVHSIFNMMDEIDTINVIYKYRVSYGT